MHSTAFPLAKEADNLQERAHFTKFLLNMYEAAKLHEELQDWDEHEEAVSKAIYESPEEYRARLKAELEVAQQVLPHLKQRVVEFLWKPEEEKAKISRTSSNAYFHLWPSSPSSKFHEAEE